MLTWLQAQINNEKKCMSQSLHVVHVFDAFNGGTL